MSRICYACGWSIGRVRTGESCRVQILLMAGRSESVMDEKKDCMALQRIAHIEALVSKARKRAESQFDKGLA